MTDVGLITIVTAALIAATPAPSAGHAPFKLSIVQPQPEPPVGSSFEVVVRAEDAVIQQVLAFHVMVDERYVDPSSGELTDSKPAFGGFTIEPGQAKTIAVTGATAGLHKLKIVPVSDHDETANQVEVQFTVRSSSLPFIGTVTAIVAGIVAIWLRQRKLSRATI